jgi:tetratricopeptide (TPR) repeat protein
LVTRAVTLQEQLLADAPDNRQIVYQTAESYVALSVLHDNLREFDAALEAVQRAEEILDGFPPRPENINEYQTFTRIRLQKSDLLILLGRHDEAMHLLGMTDFDSATREQRANKLQFESRALLKDGKFQEAWNTATEARLIYESNRGNIFARGGVAGILFDIGLIEMEMGKLADAENTFKLSTEVYDEVGSMIPYHETFACGAGQSHMNLGDVRLRLAKLQPSIDSLNRANEIFAVILDGNKVRDVYFEYAVDVELLRYDALMESDSVVSASEAVNRAQALFMNLPTPKPADGVSSDKTEKTNKWKLERSIDILLKQIRMAESVESSNSTAHVKQAEKILAYIESHFSIAGEVLQDAVKRLHALQN